MTILITGSAGHLGEALMRTLRAAGRPAAGLDRLPSPFTDHVGSIADPDFVRGAMADVTAVIHTATLHKPHIVSHSRQQFIEANLSGTLTLLEAASDAGISVFVFTSTTSAFGSALSPGRDQPAAWITEQVAAVPRNIYGVTKGAAETLCELFHCERGLPVVVLRTSRFFPEEDDNEAIRGAYALDNVQANELLYRRADIADVVDAHLLALQKAPQIGFGRYIVSATTPFSWDARAELREDAPAVVRRIFPAVDDIYAARGWKLFPSLDRVYVNAAARTALGWAPRWDFGFVLERLAAGEDIHSGLARAVGHKGYHRD